MARSLGPRATYVYEEIRARVLDGRYAPNTQLPSHDVLSLEFEVALLTVRQAIARLQEEDLLTSLQGRGTFVRRRRDDLEVTGWSLPVDVTERELVLEQLRDSEERFRAVFEGASIGMNVADFEGRFVDANPAFCAIVGYSRDEIVGKSVADITHPDDVDADLTLLKRLASGERADYELEKRY